MKGIKNQESKLKLKGGEWILYQGLKKMGEIALIYL